MSNSKKNSQKVILLHGSAKFFGQVGKAFAKALVDLKK